MQWLMNCAKDVTHASSSALPEGHSYCTEKIKINMASCVQGMFAAATVMISFGAVLGKLSVLQMIVMAIRECPLSSQSPVCLSFHVSVCPVGWSVCLAVCLSALGATL
jgi:hypothetical protein